MRGNDASVTRTRNKTRQIRYTPRSFSLSDARHTFAETRPLTCSRKFYKIQIVLITHCKLSMPEVSHRRFRPNQQRWGTGTHKRIQKWAPCLQDVSSLGMSMAAFFFVTLLVLSITSFLLDIAQFTVLCMSTVASGNTDNGFRPGSTPSPLAARSAS